MPSPSKFVPSRNVVGMSFGGGRGGASVCTDMTLVTVTRGEVVRRSRMFRGAVNKE